MTARKVAFRYYGGKAMHLGWLLPLLPPMPGETEYCEPFCGSCAVAINRRHVAKTRVFLNDIDKEVVNFFRVLRDNPEALTYALQYTPNSEYEQKQAFKVRLDEESMPNVEAAWAFAVKVYQSFGGKVRLENTTWAPYIEFGEKRAASFRDIANVIRKFHFHNDDALSVIRRHDKANTFIYADPPYTLDSRVSAGSASRAYRHELPEDDEVGYHQRFLDIAVASPAYFAISGYHSEQYDDALSGWHCHEQETNASVRAVGIGDAKPTRIECLWTNYSPADGGRQTRLV